MTSICTKYGNAYINTDGYYEIYSIQNKGKLLHRLIFEDFYQIKLPKNIVIHHDDKNKLNNNIWNLIPMTKKEHLRIHHNGKDNPNKCKPFSLEHKIKLSSSRNTTGIYRVSLTNNNGRIYCRYSYYQNKKRSELYSTNPEKLKERVLNHSLDWVIIDEDKAKITYEKLGVDYDKIEV